MKIIAIVALLFCGGALAQGGPQCQAPTGAGLASTLKELFDMIPSEKVFGLFLTAMTSDPETQAIVEYLSSSEFYEVIEAIHKEPAFTNIIDYACAELYLDIKFYLNYIYGILGFPEIRVVRSRRAGFQNLVKEILALLPIEDMKALFKEKLATDYYLQLAVQKVNSDEFGIIIETLEYNNLFSAMMNRLRGLGVDIDFVVNTISKIFKP